MGGFEINRGGGWVWKLKGGFKIYLYTRPSAAGAPTIN